LDRATELLAPEVWTAYRNKSIPMFILEDPESVRDFEKGKLAESNAQDALLDLVRSRRIELRSLHPRASPQGKWVPLSADIVSALTAPDVDLEGSTIRLPDGFDCSVRAFPTAERDVEAAPNPQNIDAADVEPPRRIPIKKRLADAFDRLTDAERALLNHRGGVKKLERILRRDLGNVPATTVQKEFLDFRRERFGPTKRR
jgi:hypothetical protein